MTGERICFKQAERISDRIDERPAQSNKLATGATRKNDACHPSARSALLVELGAQLVEGDAFSARELA